MYHELTMSREVAVLHTTQYHTEKSCVITSMWTSAVCVCACVQGYCPPVQAALEMYRLLSEPGIDLRQPVRLENQLLKEHLDMDTEVGASMLQLLQVRCQLAV